MHRFWAVVVAGALFPLAAAGLECPEWRRLGPAQRSDQLDAMIDGHLNSNVGRKYTSENPVLMRRCLESFKPDLIDQFDGVCADEGAAGKDGLDQIFDRYFLSCVQ